MLEKAKLNLQSKKASLRANKGQKGAFPLTNGVTGNHFNKKFAVYYCSLLCMYVNEFCV